MAEVSQGGLVQEPNEQPLLEPEPDGYTSGPGQGASNDEVTAEAGPDATAEDYAALEYQSALGYGADQGDLPADSADPAEPLEYVPYAEQQAQPPEATTPPGEAQASNAADSPGVRGIAQEERAPSSRPSRPSKRGSSAGGASTGRASPGSAKALERTSSSGRPPLPPPLALASPAGSAAAGTLEAGTLGSGTGSGRVSSFKRPSGRGQHRLSSQSELAQAGEGGQGEPGAGPRPGSRPELTPQGIEPEEGPAPDDFRPDEPERPPGGDPAAGTPGLSYGAGDQPPYDPEDPQNFEGGEAEPFAGDGRVGEREPFDGVAESQAAEQSGELGPPPPPPDDFDGQPQEGYVLGAEDSQQPQQYESQEGQEDPGGVADPEEASPAAQPSPGAYAFEVQAGPEGETPSGKVFITEARVKRGIPRYQPPRPPADQEPQQSPGQGLGPGQSGDGYFFGGSEAGQPAAGDDQRNPEQQPYEDGWAPGLEAEQDPSAGGEAQSPQGGGGAEASSHDQEPFFEEGEADVELQEGEGNVQGQNHHQHQQVEGEPSGGLDYSGPEYETAAELMAGGGGIAGVSAATGGASTGAAGDDLYGGGGYTGGADSMLQSPTRGYSPGEGLEGEDTYGRTGGAESAAASPSGVRGGYSTGGVGIGGDTDVMLAMERERFSLQLQMEVRAREELEDMILRIEKHFKAEQAARKKAEELLQASIAAELEAKNHLEDLIKKRREDQRQMEEERNGIKRERHALESMRQDFEAELQAARMEVAKAQEALAASEDRIRAAEAVDRARLESEYQSKISSLQEEIARLRDELAYRTQLMAQEMQRWQQQAHLTAAAVMEAKNEVLERKKELDSTKEKMDRLLDKLYIGRERNIELSGAIAAAQSYAQHAGAHGGLASIAGMMPPALLMAQGQPGGPGGARGAALLAALPGGGPNVHSSIPKLPPLNARQPLFGGGGGGELGAPLSPGARRSAPGGQNVYDGAGGANIFMPPGFMGAPPGMGPMGMMGPMGPMGPMGGPMGGFVGPGGMVGQPGGGNDAVDPYAHVQSRFAQPTEAALAKQEAAKKGRANGKGKKPDRFEEGKRDEARMAGMAKRWQ